MPDYTLPLPTEMVNDIDIEAPELPTGNLRGGAISAANTVFSLPGNLGFHKLQEVGVRAFNPGKMLTEQEAKESVYKVPGRSFKGGVPENLLKLIHKRLVGQFLIQQELDNMEPTFSAWVSRQVGTTVGFLTLAALDPFAAFPAAGVTSLTGRLMPWLLTKLEGGAAKFVAKALVGGAEGLAIGAPLSAANYLNSLDIGVNPGITSIFVNEALAGGLGASVRVIAGWKRPFISPEENNRTREVAINHVMNGKPAYVEPLIKNALYQMSKESEGFILGAEKLVPDLESELGKIDEQLTSKKSALKKIFDKRKIGTNLAEEERGSEFTDRLEEVRSKPSDLHTEEETSLLKRFATRTMREKEPTILQKAHDISEKQQIRRTPEEQSFIEDFVGDKEKEKTSQEIDKLKQKRDEFKEEMDKEISKDNKAKLRFKVSDLEDRIKKNENRLDNLRALDRLEESDGDVFKQRSDIKELETKRTLVKNNLDASSIYAKAMNVNGEPVTKSDIRANTEWINDWKSDFAYSESGFDELEQEVADIPDNVDLDMSEELNTANEMREGGVLSDEQEEFMDNFKKEDEEFNTISKALRDYVKCLIREGE